MATNRVIDFLFDIEYWKEFREYFKVRDEVKSFIENDSEDLQSDFKKQFEYPVDMTEEPIRVTENGDLYYTINFKAPELFTKETKQAAYYESLKVLDKHLLGAGLSEYLEPYEPVDLSKDQEGALAVLCTFRIVYEPDYRVVSLLAAKGLAISLGLIGAITYSILSFT